MARDGPVPADGMAHHVKRPYALMFSARLVIFGLWAVMFAFFVLYFSVQLMAALSGFDAGVLGAEAGMNLDGMLVSSVAMVYRGGFLALGVGGALMTFGGSVLLTSVR